MKRILVIGASGFVGRKLVRALLADGHGVRCMARTPDKVADLAAIGCEIIQGDIAEPTAVAQVLDGMEAVYLTIHTISPQHADTAGQGFMDVEMAGLRNVVAGCERHGVRRLIYLTSLGISPNGRSQWVRERWKAEQYLFQSGLDVTTVHPGQIVGVGGTGFNMMVTQAKSSVAVMMGGGKQRWRNIAVDDLIYYLVGILQDPRAYGQFFDVGCDDVLTSDQMVDITAAVLGRKNPFKVHIPAELISTLAPVIERLAKLPKGAFKGLVDGLHEDAIGDPAPIRQILPRPPLDYRAAVKKALALS